MMYLSFVVDYLLLGRLYGIKQLQNRLQLLVETSDKFPSVTHYGTLLSESKDHIQVFPETNETCYQRSIMASLY